MKKTVCVSIIILLAAALFVSCDADKISKTGQALEKLQGVNLSGYADVAADNAKTEIKGYVNSLSGGLPNISSVESGHYLRDEETIKSFRANLQKCVSAVLSASESGISRAELKKILEQQVPDIEDAWDGDSHNNTKYMYLSAEPLIGFNIVFAVNDTEFAKLLGFSTQILFYQHHLSDKIQDLMHGGGSGSLPGSFADIKQILKNDIFGAAERHLKDGYLTYADYIMTGMLTDILYTARDFCYDDSTRIDVSAVKDEGLKRIVAYCDVLEIAYGVDLDIVRRISEVI